MAVVEPVMLGSDLLTGLLGRRDTLLVSQMGCADHARTALSIASVQRESKMFPVIDPGTLGACAQ